MGEDVSWPRLLDFLRADSRSAELRSFPPLGRRRRLLLRVLGRAGRRLLLPAFAWFWDQAFWVPRAGSRGWRMGPLPRKQSAPPCSRKCVGEVGSTPSVRFMALAFFLARNAARMRSGVNGASRKRMPTAS